MKNIEELRKNIEKIDDEILSLIKRRVEIAVRIGEEKKKNGLNIYDPNRENEIIDKIKFKSQEMGLPYDYIEDIFLLIMSMTRNIQERISIALLGPEGTFSEIAVTRRFGYDVEKIYAKNISDIFREVSKGKANVGVVPIENSYNGVVAQTLDNFVDSHLKIMGEIFLRVHHSLLSKEDNISKIKTLYSHPQALGQCKEWIENNLSNVEIIETSSTSEATKIASTKPQSGAIGNEILSKKYNLKILAKNIEDDPMNTTRFWIIGEESVNMTGDDKTTILCYINDKPGALFDLIKPFKDMNVNMTKIESRPSRIKLWDYLFFIDFEGHTQDHKIQKLLTEVEKNASLLKILGSYPKGIVLE
ncbi:MAG: prephenate dehydratase [Brevinematales bacterium]|nr:prephenate dehydratase [Brevinematales bacterium]